MLFLPCLLYTSRFAQKRGYYAMELPDIPLPKMEQEEISILSDTAQRRLEGYLNQSNDLCKLGILVCLYTGLRIGEICALQWGDIRFEAASIYVRRTVLRIPENLGSRQKTRVIFNTPKTRSSMREVPLPIFCLLYTSQPFFPCLRRFVNVLQRFPTGSQSSVLRRHQRE